MRNKYYLIVIILLLLANLSFAQGTWEWAHLLWNNHSNVYDFNYSMTLNSYIIIFTTEIFLATET